MAPLWTPLTSPFGRSKRHLELAQVRYEAGSAARLDVLRAEVELANARARLIRAGLHPAIKACTLGGADRDGRGRGRRRDDHRRRERSIGVVAVDLGARGEMMTVMMQALLRGDEQRSVAPVQLVSEARLLSDAHSLAPLLRR